MRHGIFMLENLDLRGLAADKVYEFMFVLRLFHSKEHRAHRAAQSQSDNNIPERVRIPNLCLQVRLTRRSMTPKLVFGEQFLRSEAANINPSKGSI
jgi:hypothetical protein